MDAVALAAVVAAASIALIATIALYNGLVSARNAADNAFGSVDVQLKQRCDLVPRVVDTVRGHMEYERDTLERLTALRSEAIGPDVKPASRFALDGQIGALLAHVFSVAEQYPTLKSSTSVLLLQRTLNEVEAQIAAARRTYNAAATEYNTCIESFPANIAAGILGFRRRSLFEASPSERAPMAMTALGAE